MGGLHCLSHDSWYTGTPPAIDRTIYLMGGYYYASLTDLEMSLYYYDEATGCMWYGSGRPGQTVTVTGDGECGSRQVQITVPGSYSVYGSADDYPPAQIAGTEGWYLIDVLYFYGTIEEECTPNTQRRVRTEVYSTTTPGTPAACCPPGYASGKFQWSVVCGPYADQLGCQGMGPSELCT